MVKLQSICLPVLIFISIQALPRQSTADSIAATKEDTITYFEDLSHLLNVNIYNLVKSNSVTLRFGNDRLVLRPNSPVSLGFGVNYKGFGLALGVGLPHTKERIDKFGRTKRLDVQMNLNTRWLMGAGHLQVYRGYYHANPGDFTQWDQNYFPTLPDMRTVSLGASAFFVFNHKEFSPKAALSRTQIQKRSAGSFVLGLYGNYDEASSPEGFIPKEFADSIATDLDIQSYKYYSIGVMFGYMHTWVIKKRFFIHGSIIPGLGYKNIRMNFNQKGGGTEHKPDAQVFLRAAFGYEATHFYLGVSASTLVRNVKYNDYNIDMSTDSFRFFVGKRFDLSGKKSRKH
jgi:hypothetical protein